MTATRTLVVLALAIATAGCGSGAPSVPTQVRTSLLADLAPLGEAGFRVRADATGPMTLSTAASATTLRPERLRDYLEEAGYDGGYARVLTRGAEFVSLLGFELDRPEDARGLVDLAVDQLATSAAFRPFSDPALPDARGFTLVSDVSGQVRFCVGEWFAVQRRAYAVTRCAPFALSVPAVTGIAAAQHSAAEAANL